jgi:hypothetical protein
VWRPATRGFRCGVTSHSQGIGDAVAIDRMYTLHPIAHPVLDRVRLLGARELKVEKPTGHLYVFVDADTTRHDLRAIRSCLSETWPDQRVIVSVRASLARTQPARCVGSREPAVSRANVVREANGGR